MVDTVPTDYLNIQITPDQEAAIKSMVSSAIPTQIYTHYIVVGDEPPDSIMTIDLSNYMSVDDFNTLSQNLRYMPRANLKDFLDQYIRPVVDPQYFDIVKKAIINLFNTVNVDEINKRAIGPWVWEQQKTEALYLSSANVQMENLTEYLNPVPPTADQLREAKITADYASLPPIGDLSLEIRRQAAVKGLLNLKEYDAAQQIIDAYKNADENTVKVLVNSDMMASLPINPDPTTQIPQATT